MEFNSIKHSLSDLIDKSITPLITGNYVFWGLPNYPNEGDVLIWQGTRSFLKTIPHRCVGTLFYDEYQYRELAKDTVILIMGGGYFGDTWRKAWEYVVNTVSLYPDNPIVFLPQSIHYQSDEFLSRDREMLAKCKHLTICARDKSSYDFARNHFGQHRILLVPDMAFYIKDFNCKKRKGKGSLYIKREDKESVPLKNQSLLNDVDLITDWPSIKGYASLTFCFSVYAKLRRFWSRPFPHYLSVCWMEWVYRPIMIRHAIRLLKPFRDVYTSRLHGALLALMMGKNVHYLDNTYGKLSNLHHTWLLECDNLERFD